MKVRGRSLFVLAVLAAACSNSATTPTSAPPVTAAPVTTTTTPPATTTTTTTIAATTIPATTTTLSGDTVGNPAALEALIDRVVAEVGAVNLGGRENVPVFSANDPDPSVALKSNLDLEDWVFKTFPDPAWAEVLTYPNSPAFFEYRTNFDTAANAFVRWEDVGEPFMISSLQQVDLDALPISQTLIDDAPEGSVGFVFDSSKGAYRKVRIDSGEVVEERDGWESIRFAVILAPTGVGWQIFVSEVLDE